MKKQSKLRCRKSSPKNSSDNLLNKVILILLLAVILVGLVSLVFYLQLSPLPQENLNQGKVGQGKAASSPAQAMVSLRIIPPPERASPSLNSREEK